MAKKRTEATKKIHSGESCRRWYCQTCQATTNQPIVRTKTVKSGERVIYVRECQACQSRTTTIEMLDHF